MTGIQARDFIITQIQEKNPKGKNMKLSRLLATDLLKLTRSEIGPLSEKMFKHGVHALKKHGLFGYTVDINLNQSGYVVEFRE